RRRRRRPVRPAPVGPRRPRRRARSAARGAGTRPLRPATRTARVATPLPTGGRLILERWDQVLAPPRTSRGMQRSGLVQPFAAEPARLSGVAGTRPPSIVRHRVRAAQGEGGRPVAGSMVYRQRIGDPDAPALATFREA